MLRNTKVSLLCHSTEKACSSGAGLSASAIFSMASRCRVAFASAFSAASRAFFEALACHQENTAPTIVKTAHAAMTAFAADSKASSSARYGCRTRSCGVVGTSHLTGEKFPVGGDFQEERRQRNSRGTRSPTRAIRGTLIDGRPSRLDAREPWRESVGHEGAGSTASTSEAAGWPLRYTMSAQRTRPTAQSTSELRRLNRVSTHERPHLPKRQVGSFVVPTLYPHAQQIGARSAIGGDCGDGGNRTPVQWPAPNSSPSAVYGFISQPLALRRHTAR